MTEFREYLQPLHMSIWNQLLTITCRVGEYGQDFYTLKRIYIEERGPKTVHMHWRRFAISSIPISDSKAFDSWLHERWIEKDTLLEYHLQHGHFPTGGDDTSLSNKNNGDTVEAAQKSTNASSQGEIVCPRAGPKHPLEFVQIFISLIAVPIVWKIVKFFIRVVSFLTQ